MLSEFINESTLSNSFSGETRPKLYLELLAERFLGKRWRESGDPSEQLLTAFVDRFQRYEAALTGFLRPQNPHFLFKLPFIHDDLAYQELHLIAEFLSQYVCGRAKVHMIASLFGNHLAKTKLNLPMSVLPDREGQKYCFEFPDDIRFVNYLGEYHRSCMVQIATNRDGHRTISIIAPDLDERGAWKDSTSQATISDEYPTIEENLAHIPLGEFEQPVITPEMIAYTMKCLVYVESGEPDLESQAGHKILTRNPKKARRQAENRCPFDIVRVGYSFYKGITRHVADTRVSGHFRWQPWGPGLTRIKLIWINEHVRTFGQIGQLGGVDDLH